MTTQLILKHQKRQNRLMLMGAYGYTFICVAAIPTFMQVAHHAPIQMVSTALWASMISALAIAASQSIAKTLNYAYGRPKPVLQALILSLVCLVLMVGVLVAWLLIALGLSKILPLPSNESRYISTLALLLATLCQFFPMIWRAPDPTNPDAALAIPPQSE